MDALVLSLEVTAIALALIVVGGHARGMAAGHPLVPGPVAGHHAGRAAAGGAPAVAGIGLLAALGPEGLLGGALEAAGVELVFQTAGVVVALVFVASPFYIRQALAAFGALDPA